MFIYSFFFLVQSVDCFACYLIISCYIPLLDLAQARPRFLRFLVLKRWVKVGQCLTLHGYEEKLYDWLTFFPFFLFTGFSLTLLTALQFTLTSILTPYLLKNYSSNAYTISNTLLLRYEYTN